LTTLNLLQDYWFIVEREIAQAVEDWLADCRFAMRRRPRRFAASPGRTQNNPETYSPAVCVVPTTACRTAEAQSKCSGRKTLVQQGHLTGFDAPCVHTLYVDKPMKGHNLMQAIARVNRVFKDKQGGLVVDYIGIANELKSALREYTASNGRGRPTVPFHVVNSASCWIARRLVSSYP
jgi:hypothetical protein